MSTGERPRLELSILQTRQLLRLIRVGVPGDRQSLTVIENMLLEWLNFGAEGPDNG